eukprot:2386419-Rhodomonas_salina.1
MLTLRVPRQDTERLAGRKFHHPALSTSGSAHADTALRKARRRRKTNSNTPGSKHANNNTPYTEFGVQTRPRCLTFGPTSEPRRETTCEPPRETDPASAARAATGRRTYCKQSTPELSFPRFQKSGGLCGEFHERCAVHAVGLGRARCVEAGQLAESGEVPRGGGAARLDAQQPELCGRRGVWGWSEGEECGGRERAGSSRSRASFHSRRVLCAVWTDAAWMAASSSSEKSSGRSSSRRRRRRGGGERAACAPEATTARSQGARTSRSRNRRRSRRRRRGGAFDGGRRRRSGGECGEDAGGEAPRRGGPRLPLPTRCPLSSASASGSAALTQAPLLPGRESGCAREECAEDARGEPRERGGEPGSRAAGLCACYAMPGTAIGYGASEVRG